MANNASDPSPYVKARIVAGLVLIFGVLCLAFIDAISDSYSFELGPMGLMLGTGTLLLGVEVARKIISGG